MIKLTTAKLLIASILVVVLLALGFFAVNRSGALITLFSSGAATEDALSDVDTVPTMADTLVTWQPDEWTRERVMESVTRIDLESAYLRAWAAMGAYPSTADADPVEDTFSGQAKNNVLELPTESATALWSLGHRLRLTFYSRDGSIVAFEDEAARIVRQVVINGESTIIESVEPYSVVMVLEDGYWRIKQLLRTGQDTTVITTAASSGTPVVAGMPATEESTPAPAGRALAYPSALWTNPDTDIGEDVGLAQSLGATRLRVELPSPDPTASGATDDTLERLADVLDAARSANIAVDLVLLSATVSDEPAVWPVIDAFVRTVLEVAADDVRVIDLMNGVDASSLDVTRAALITHVSALVSERAPQHAQTIGWQISAGPDASLQEFVDEITLVGDAGSTPWIDAIANTAASEPAPPISIVIDAPSTAPNWSPIPYTAHAQASAIAATLLATESLSATAVSVGDLRDTLPDGGSGVLAFGGSSKVAATLVAPTIDPADIGGLTVVDFALTRFWQLSVAVLFVTAGLATLWTIRRSRRRRRRGEWSL